MKPGIPAYKGYQQGVDYFVHESHLKKYVVQKYGWKDRVENNQNGSKRNKALPTKTKNTPTSIIKPKGTSRKSGHQLPKPQSKNKLKRKMSTSKTKELKSTNNVIERDAVQPIASIKNKTKKSLQRYKHARVELGNDSEDDSYKESVKIVKGTKTKPGFISFEENIDYRIGRKVAFLINSQEGQTLSKYFNNNIPAEALQTVSTKSDVEQYLVGVINKRAKTTNRKNCYTVAWEYSCDELHEIDFEATVIDRSIAQHQRFSKLMNKALNSKQHNKFPTSIPTNLVDKYLKDYDATNNDGDIIESDDCFSDDDGLGFDDLHVDYNVNNEDNYGYIYNQIRHSNIMESDLTMEADTKREDKPIRSEKINGLKWEMNGKLQPPVGLGFRPDTKIKNNCSVFSSELESLLAFFPLQFWVYHLNECNRYVDEYLSKKEQKTKKFVGANWKPIVIDELMIFYAILLQMVCRPFPGKRYEECWDKTEDWFPNCKRMNKTRFKQIRAALHWCDNPHSKSSEDTLYKVRPMINILERTIGKYLEVGQELALDETTIGLYHAYAKALTYYNPSKPRGKHHCKLFTLCENNHWAVINFKFSHRSYKPNDDNKKPSNKSKKRKSNNKPKKGKRSKNRHKGKLSLDSDDDTVTDDDDDINDDMVTDEEDDDDKKDDEISKMVKLVTSLCECVRGTGVVINMDNLYSSPEVFIQLQKMGIYARGTFRCNRKYLPQFIKFSKSEVQKLPRGCFRLATNKKHNLSCYAWNDKNPVHVLSSADGTMIESTQRRSKSKKIEVLCPSAIKMYNQGMQGVDQFNKLLTLFSLANLKFDKYYKKIAMVLLDFAITNAYLHFKIANEKKMDRKYSRVMFMENLQEQMINVDWSERVRLFNMDTADDQSDDSDFGPQTKSFDEMMKIGDYAPDINTDQSPIVTNPILCNPIAMRSNVDSLNKNLSERKRTCQICEYEGRGRKRTGVNYCPTHNIRACTLHHPDPMTMETFTYRGNVGRFKLEEDAQEWLCPDSTLTCWEKAHSFYIPNGLFKMKDKVNHQNVNSPDIDFNDVATINMSSKMYLKRKAYLSRVNATSVEREVLLPSTGPAKGWGWSYSNTIDVPSHAVDVPSIKHSDNEDEKTSKLMQSIEDQDKYVVTVKQEQ